MKKAVFLNGNFNTVKRVYGDKFIRYIDEKFGLAVTAAVKDLAAYENELKDCEYAFSTWGMPVYSEAEILRYLPSLKAVFYAAGAVKSFAAPFLNAGVKIFSARDANAVPVIETAVSQILLANKGFYFLSALAKTDYKKAVAEREKFKGNYGAEVGLIGLGTISRGVAQRLKSHDVKVYMYSTYATDEEIIAAGAIPLPLDEIFARCDAISNHLADTPDTVKIMGAKQFGLMKPYSTFINTGRGAQVDECALKDKLTADPTVTAVLDVTYPEPPDFSNGLFSLPNVMLTPHSAGSSGEEVHRMAAYMVRECENFASGGETKCEITKEMLSRMA